MTKTQVLLFAWGKQFLSAFPVCTLLSTLQALCLSTTISCIAIQELRNTNTMQTAKYNYKYKQQRTIWIQIQVQIQIQIYIQKYKTSQSFVSSPPHFTFKTIMNLGILFHCKAAILFNKEPSRSPLHLAQGREDNLSKRLPIWDDNLGIGCPPEYGEITWA